VIRSLIAGFKKLWPERTGFSGAPVTRYFWFVVAPLTIVPLVAVLAGDGLASFDTATAFILPVAFSAFLSGYTYLYNRSLARIQLASSVLFLAGIWAVVIIEKINPASFYLGQGALIYGLVATWCIYMLFLVISSGVLIIRLLGRTNKIDFAFASAKPLDISFVRHSFSNIRQAFSATQEAVSREASFIDEAVGKFQAVLDSKEQRLLEMQSQMEQARQEIEAYEALAKLSRSERDSFFFMLNKRKRGEYLIAFVLGVIASVVAQLVFWLWEWINSTSQISHGSFF